MNKLFYNLTLTMQRKSNKLIDLNNKIQKEKESLINICKFALIPVFYIVLNINSYINYVISVFNNLFPYFSTYTSTLNILSKLMFIILVVFILLIFSKMGKIQDLKHRFNVLRLDIITSIDNEFCNHPQSCSCKDDYIRDMDTFSIDVIFK